ncbi:hypothetical protein nbrc107696_12210 [Gordonia spumicola]|uniref:Uncharacterized protein n=1 Tax=Gordonia spumicola TaxID=589161 RepID=A0A7I9V5S7_9ACTN|nr:hypothetical protein nbrc107696_12210 [Gordonia spumicola]
MSYVMSSREVQEFQSSFQKAAFTVEGVSVEFETDAGIRTLGASAGPGAGGVERYRFGRAVAMRAFR